MLENKHKVLKFIVSILMVTMILVPFLKTAEQKVFAQNEKQESSQESLGDFVGEWSAGGYTLGTGEYTAFLRMYINKDGSFSIYDGEAGNPGIKGKLEVVDDTKIRLTCKAEDFDSPWDGLKLTDELEYHFYNSNQVRLTYQKESIVFYRKDKEFYFDDLFSGNWYRDINLDLYNNDGVNVDTTYKLDLDSGNIRIFKVEKNEKETMLCSFCVLSFNKKTGILKTITELEDASKLPEDWRGMKEGRHFQYFKLSYNSSKHRITLTNQKKSYSFYSNITYGIKKGSDYDKAQSNDWECQINGRKIQFNTELRDGEYSLSVFDWNHMDAYWGSATISLDETKKTVRVVYDRKRSTKQFCKNHKKHMTITYHYSFKNGKLILKNGKTSYTFHKIDR